MITCLRGLLVVALLAGCASVSPSPSASVLPSPSLEPTGSAAASAMPLDLSLAAWWRLGWYDDPAAMPDHDHLRIGLLDGMTSLLIATGGMWAERSGAPLVRGPVSGLVLYGRAVAGGIDLHLVWSAAGDDRSVALIPAGAEDAEIAPGGDSVYWIDRDPVGGGVWRLDWDTGERTRILAPVQVAAATDGTVLAASAFPWAGLALSADGASLAALWCGVERCLLQVVRLGDDAIQGVLIRETWHDLLGFAADGVALSGACADPLAQQVLDTECEQPDARARAAYLALNLRVGAELPAGWTFDVIPDPDAEPMTFQMQAVAIPDEGGEPIVLDALGILSGQG